MLCHSAISARAICGLPPAAAVVVVFWLEPPLPALGRRRRGWVGVVVMAPLPVEAPPEEDFPPRPRLGDDDLYRHRRGDEDVYRFRTPACRNES